MEQLIHLANSQPSAQVFQQQAGADDFSIAPATEDYDLTKVKRNKSILTVLYGNEVENLLGAIKTEEALRNSQDELRQISMQLLNIQENERQRIASDLHDGIGQSLSLIKLSLESVVQLVNTGERQAAVESLQQLEHKVKETMAELHRTTMDMRPAMLDDLGIIPTLSWFFREFESAWRDRKVEKDVSIAECDVPVALKATIFRILQEAMNNIVKHAGADLIRVSLKKDGGILRLSIDDNGQGFDISGASVRRGSNRGFGLFTMKERARSTGGSFDMQSILESGTRIVISWRLLDDIQDKVSAGSASAPDPSHACNR